MDEHSERQYPVYAGEHGPTQFPSRDCDLDLVEFWDRLFPDKLCDLIVEQTNLYAHQRGVEWHDTDITEMVAAVV